jgi:EpsI family protein
MVGKKRVLWLAIVTLAAANGLMLLGTRGQDRTLQAHLAGLPAELGGWVGGPVFRSGEARDLGGDDVLSRGYVRDTGERIWLYVGFWRSQRAGQPVALSPGRAHPGPEWKVMSTSVAWIGGEDGGPRRAIRQVVYERLGEKQAVTYWYVQGAGRVVTDWYVGRLAMVWDAVRWGRSDVALIRLASPIRAGEATPVLEGQRRFADRIAPLVAQCLPG